MALRHATQLLGKQARRRKRPLVRTAAATLSAAAALLLAPAVVLPAHANDGLKVGPGVQPLAVLEGPDGTLYVSDYRWDGGVGVYPPGETTPSRTIEVGGLPTSLAMTQDGTLYVALFNESAQGEIGVVAPGAGEAELAIQVSRGSNWLTVGPGGSLYVLNRYEDTVTVVKQGDAWVTRFVQGGPYPVEMAMAQDGTAYITNELAGTVTVVPGGSPAPSHTIDVGATAHPHGIAAAPDGTVFVANISTNDVAVIEPGGTAVARRIPVGIGPQEVVVGADGTVYVSNSVDDSVSVIPAGAVTVSETIPTGGDPGRMAVRRDGSVVVVNRGGKSLTVIKPPTPELAAAAPAGASAGAAGSSGHAEVAAAAEPANGGSLPSIQGIAAVAGGVVLCGALALVVLLRRRTVAATR